jgi:hypothetical protein
VIGILDAAGAIYKEYGDNPLIQLFTEENGKRKYVLTITSSKYQQVPAGRYVAVISMGASPQSSIVVNAGAENHLALRLGKLELDPRNFDGTASKQEISVYAITDEPIQGNARLTNTVVTLLAKGGDKINLAPGRYIVHSRYGLLQKDTITIRAQECTKLTITGAAKFTATKEGIDIKKIIPGSVPQWIALLKNGEEIQLPPGLYEIKERYGNQKAYRLKMESGQVYSYETR